MGYTQYDPIYQYYPCFHVYPPWMACDSPGSFEEKEIIEVYTFDCLSWIASDGPILQVLREQNVDLHIWLASGHRGQCFTTET